MHVEDEGVINYKSFGLACLAMILVGLAQTGTVRAQDRFTAVQPSVVKSTRSALGRWLAG